MRVTKLIREYVCKRVAENFPKTAEELAWEEKSKKMNDALTEANDKVEAYANQVVKELNEKYGFSEGYSLKAYDGRSFVTTKSMWNDEMYEAAKKAERERNDKVHKAIEEILITLELGGTKADLEKMFAEIGK